MEYIHLVGAEQVQSAGRQMQGAADDMRCAASNIDSALHSHVDRLIDALSSHARAMDDFLDGFKGALERIKPPELLQVIDPKLDPTLCNKPVDGETCVLKPGHDGPCNPIPF